MTKSGSASGFDPRAIARVVRTVALLNLGYFVVEFAVARSIGSVSLFADSIDFLEDGFVNVLIFVAIGWSAARRSRVGMLLAALLLIPGIATLWTAWGQIVRPEVPAAVPLTLVGAGALAVNLFCTLLLVRLRDEGGSLTRAAFLSARNDVVANFAIIAAGFATQATASIWPDLVVGLAISFLHLDAAREVFGAAKLEREAGVERSERSERAQRADPSGGTDGAPGKGE
jgi:Co/Zn/Cd efflux system component